MIRCQQKTKRPSAILQCDGWRTIISIITHKLTASNFSTPFFSAAELVPDNQALDLIAQLFVWW
jgi:hypothetical protein